MKALPGVQDTRKWCEFHQNHSHRMDECYALQLAVAKLLKQGHLKDLLTERGWATRDKIFNGTKDDTPPVPLRQDRIINVISNSFEVSRVSYMPAKRSSRRIDLTEVHKTKEHDLEALHIINFHSDESNYRNNLHDDALVISLSIANCLTKWILVDNGSSANVLFCKCIQGNGAQGRRHYTKMHFLGRL